MSDRRKAFLRLVRDNRARLRRICRVYSEEREEERDLFQEILFQAWRSLPSFEGEAKPATWLYRVALNTALGQKRKRDVRSRARLDEDDPVMGSRPPRPDRNLSENRRRERLLERVHEESEAFDRKIRRRDLLETLAAVVVATAFGYEAVTVETWVARLGALIVVGSSAFIVWWLRRARKTGRVRSADLPVAERLRAERERIESQIRLLESVLWWYAGPLAVGAALFVLGLQAGAVATAATLTVIVAVSSFVWWLNRRAVRRDLRPRRRELNRLIDTLEEEA
jgi:RNA polymerase sigma-70 factor (ECF subfamily)